MGSGNLHCSKLLNLMDLLHNVLRLAVRSIKSTEKLDEEVS